MNKETSERRAILKEKLNFDQNDTHKKFSDFFIPIKVLGKGSYGVVVLALDKKKSSKVAVKVFFSSKSYIGVH